MGHSFIYLAIYILSLKFKEIESSIGEIENEIVKCDGKAKTNSCGIYQYDKVTSVSTFHLIENECRKNEICTYIEGSGNGYMLQCLNRIKIKRPGESCGYDEDCITNICDNGKCGFLKNGETCSSTFPQCGNFSSCPVSEGKCIELAQKDQTCGKDKNCIYGTECNYNDNKCYAIASVENGKPSGTNELICKNGQQYNGICIQVEKDGKCVKKEVIKNEETKEIGYEFYCENLKIIGSNYHNDLKCVDYAGENEEKNYVCPINKGKEEIWLRYIQRLNEFKMDKLLKDEKALYNEGDFKYNFKDSKMSYYYTIYKNAAKFIARGLLSEEGEIPYGKDCEGKFLYLMLNSNRIEVSFTLLILFVTLII